MVFDFKIRAILKYMNRKLLWADMFKVNNTSIFVGLNVSIPFLKHTFWEKYMTFSYCNTPVSQSIFIKSLLLFENKKIVYTLHFIFKGTETKKNQMIWVTWFGPTYLDCSGHMTVVKTTDIIVWNTQRLHM